MSGEATLGDWAGAARATVKDCLFAPGTSSEFPSVDLEALQALGTLYAPPRADIRPEDRVEAAGAVWDVLGRPADWSGPDDRFGIVATLRWVRNLQGGTP